MNEELPATVVVDTDAFSQVFVATTGPHHRELRDRLVGRIPVIATQTFAELLAWRRLAGWGPNRANDLNPLISLDAVYRSTAGLTLG